MAGRKRVRHAPKLHEESRAFPAVMLSLIRDHDACPRCILLTGISQMIALFLDRRDEEATRENIEPILRDVVKLTPLALRMMKAEGFDVKASVIPMSSEEMNIRNDADMDALMNSLRDLLKATSERRGKTTH